MKLLPTTNLSGLASAGNLLTLLTRAPFLIRENPFHYPEVLSDVRRSYVRRFPYALYYQIRTGSVVVLSVLHARRDPMEWRERA